ncbi:MAG: transporter substrate-binding domain-containing protein [Pseudomonadota bacterium]
MSNFPVVKYLSAITVAIAVNLGVVVSQPALASEAPSFRDPEARIDAPSLEGLSLQFLTTDDFPPFNYVTSSGELAGFHVDLARALCEALSIQCTVEVRPWETLISAAESREEAVLLAGIAANAETRENLVFTSRYFSMPGRFATRQTEAAPSAPSLALDGKTVGVVEGSAHDQFLKAYWPNVPRLYFANVNGAQSALKAGVVDFIFGDAVALSFWLNSEVSESCCRFIGGPFEDDIFFGEGLRIAVPRTRPDIAQALDFALDRVQRDGSFREIYLRHFPISIY